MTIAAILKHKGYEVARVAPTATIAEVAARLAEERIGAILVMDTADQILGIVSERDIVRHLPEHGSRTLEMTAAQLMTQGLHTASPHMGVPEAMELMTNRRIRHLPVVQEGMLIGIVSIGDIVKARMEQQGQEVDSLKAYVAGSV